MNTGWEQGESTCAVFLSKIPPGQGVRGRSIPFLLCCFLDGLLEDSSLRGAHNFTGRVWRAQWGPQADWHCHFRMESSVLSPALVRITIKFPSLVWAIGPLSGITDHSPPPESLFSLGPQDPTLSRCPPLSVAVPTLQLPLPQPVP